ncbi:MAG TPA: penicillin-binding protein 1B [Steroidobacteraceae bacterium]|nr:penicillin-binding protein 1B [Steroidobacteraceae bacterium]
MKRRAFSWRRVLLTILGLGALAFAIYVIRLDHIVREQFEGRRWSLPAQVYAAPLELYAGLPLSASDVERELRRLQYRRMDALPHPGTYRKAGDEIDVSLRAARFADELRPAQRLSIRLDGTGIQALQDASGRDLPLVRFEPALIGSIFPIHGEDRLVVTPGEVPALLPAALKAVEDRNFDTHHGIDLLAIARALWVDARAGQIEQGGSTLTQQLVKSYFLTPRRTAARKIQEAIMAVLLEAHFSKSDLMNAYINEIHLGQDGDRAIHGFGLASEFYFGKPLAELDLQEIATLVAVVRGPSYYDPRRHPDRALKRRNLVLKLMADQHIVPVAEAQAAAARPLGVTARAGGTYYPAFLDLVRRTLRRDYPLEQLTEAGLKVFTNLDPRVQSAAEQILDRELARLDRAHRARGAPLQGSVVVTAPQSGDVIAVVGGRDAGFDGFDRALDGRRPIGSLVKPFIYLAALESGRYNATSIVQDTPVAIKVARNKLWEPENFTRQSNGPVPLVRALAESLNQATVNLGMDIGLPTVAHSLERFGLAQPPPQNPALLLGSVELTPLEVAQLYTGLANGGFRTNLRAVRAVISADGKALKGFPLEVHPVAQPDAVYQVDSMLEQVMDRGTGRPGRAFLPASLVVAGKSGTSSDLRDSWFAGFSGSHLVVVWVGYDDDRVTGLTGSAGALPIWAHLMGGIGTSSWSTPMPESLKEVTIDYPSGLRAQPDCSSDLVSVPVPLAADPPIKPDCGGGTATAQSGQGEALAPGQRRAETPERPAESLLERAGQWLRDLFH